MMLLLVLNTHRFVTLIIIPFAATIWLLTNEYSPTRRLLESKLLVVLGVRKLRDLSFCKIRFTAGW